MDDDDDDLPKSMAPTDGTFIIRLSTAIQTLILVIISLNSETLLLIIEQQ